MNPNSKDPYTQAYNKWVTDQSPDNMAELVSAFAPTINSELQQYSGSKELLRSRAKSYVVQAIRSYNPLGKTSLNSWVVTNLKQLSRYGKRLRPIRASEDVIRNAAELHKETLALEDRLGRKPTDEELQEVTGWNPKELARLRAASIPTVAPMDTNDEDVEQAPSDMAVSSIDEIPFLRDSLYMSLDDRDREIYDYRLGEHGKPQISSTDIARRLGVSPAYISQRAAEMGRSLTEL